MVQDTNRYTDTLNEDRDIIELELNKSKEDFNEINGNVQNYKKKYHKYKEM